MKRIHSYYRNSLRQDLITKFTYQSLFELPFLKKILLTFSLSHLDIKNLLPLVTALLLISSCDSILVSSKKPSLKLKIKEGVFIKCQVGLYGKEKFYFFEKLIFFILPRLKNFSYYLNKSGFSFFFNDFYLFREIGKEYEHLQDLPELKISFQFQAKSFQEIFLVLSGLKFPL